MPDSFARRAIFLLPAIDGQQAVPAVVQIDAAVTALRMLADGTWPGLMRVLGDSEHDVTGLVVAAGAAAQRCPSTSPSSRCQPFVVAETARLAVAIECADGLGTAAVTSMKVGLFRSTSLCRAGQGTDGVADDI